MDKYLLDSYAIVEYLMGSKLGEKVKDIVDSERSEVLISVISISEILSKAIRQGMDIIETKKILFSMGRIINLDIEIAELAGEIHAKIRESMKDFGLADAIIFASSKKFNAKLITGDKHFKNMGGVIFLE